MGKIRFICMALAITSLQFAVAQDTVEDEMAIIQNEWGMAKKEVVNLYMGMDDAEAAKFWPVYDSYIIERKKLGAERFAIIEDYAKAYENLNDVQATDLTKRMFKNNMGIEKLQLKYFKKLSKAVSPVEASKFMQLEKYMETVIKAEVLEIIPFIGEIDRSN